MYLTTTTFPPAECKAVWKTQIFDDKDRDPDLDNQTTGFLFNNLVLSLHRGWSGEVIFFF